MALKSDLRREYRRSRNNLSAQVLAQYNEQLLTQFKAYPMNGIRFMHFFLPIQKFKEPDTYPMIHWVLKEHPEIKIVLPKSNLETNLMEHFLWDGQENLKKNSWGIEEPEDGIKVLPKQLDIVFIPLLSFDRNGNRVGYGKGFYDRFLMECRQDCQKIGLSYFDPIDNITDVDRYDVKLDSCITTNKTYFF